MTPSAPPGASGPAATGGTGLPRVGHIDFLNCLPLYWGLERTGAAARMTLVRDTPDRLSDALVAGDLDVGPISLVEYLRHHEDLLLLPDLAVGSDGPVMSVVLVSRLPLEQLGGRRVALGSTSRTSVLLARLLLEQRHGVVCDWFTATPDLRAMLREADAAVLIGDAALRATLVDGAAMGVDVHDLGAEWKAWTGLPMVFAVWAARRSWAEAHPQAAQAVHRDFLASRDASLAALAEVAAEAARWEAYEPAQLERYFRSLDFSLGPAQRAGLAEFARRVAPLAATRPSPSVELLAERDRTGPSPSPRELDNGEVTIRGLDQSMG